MAEHCTELCAERIGREDWLSTAKRIEAESIEAERVEAERIEAERIEAENNNPPTNNQPPADDVEESHGAMTAGVGLAALLAIASNMLA